MLLQKVRSVLVVALSMSGAAAPWVAAQGIRADQLDKLQGLIRPAPREAIWAAIPWMTSLCEAREKAAKEGKPLLMWGAGVGHPLGLT